MTIDSISPASGGGFISGALDGDQSLDLDQDDRGAPQSRPGKGAAVAVACIVSVCRVMLETGLTIARPVVRGI